MYNQSWGSCHLFTAVASGQNVDDLSIIVCGRLPFTRPTASEGVACHHWQYEYYSARERDCASLSWILFPIFNVDHSNRSCSAWKRPSFLHVWLSYHVLLFWFLGHIRLLVTREEWGVHVTAWPADNQAGIVHHSETQIRSLFGRLWSHFWSRSGRALARPCQFMTRLKVAENFDKIIPVEYWWNILCPGVLLNLPFVMLSEMSTHTLQLSDFLAEVISAVVLRKQFSLFVEDEDQEKIALCRKQNSY